MRKVLIFIFLFISLNLGAQFIYNPQDTTFTVGVTELNKIYIEIQSNRNKIEALDKELRLTDEILFYQTEKIQKLELKDSLANRELELYKDLEVELFKKIERFEEITRNYNLLILTKDTELGQAKKALRREKFWKEVYKWGLPVLGGITAYLILK